MLGCIVYNSPGCSVASDALRAMCDGVELYKLRAFDDSASSVVSNFFYRFNLGKCSIKLSIEIVILRPHQRSEYVPGLSRASSVGKSRRLRRQARSRVHNHENLGGEYSPYQHE